MHSKDLQMSGLKFYKNVPTFDLRCCFLSFQNVSWTSLYRGALGGAQQFWISLKCLKINMVFCFFLKIRFITRGLLCDILLLYYNVVKQLLLHYLSRQLTHKPLLHTTFLSTLSLRKWSWCSCVLWFHMLTLFNCKSSSVRFIALVCYCGISRRWIVFICAKVLICLWMFSVHFHFCIKANLYVESCRFLQLQKDFCHLKPNRKGILIDAGQRFEVALISCFALSTTNYSCFHIINRPLIPQESYSR